MAKIVTYLTLYKNYAPRIWEVLITALESYKHSARNLIIPSIFNSFCL